MEWMKNKEKRVKEFSRRLGKSHLRREPSKNLPHRHRARGGGCSETSYVYSAQRAGGARIEHVRLKEKFSCEIFQAAFSVVAVLNSS